MQWVFFLAAALSVFVTGAIVYILLYDTVLFFREVSIISFLTDTEWTPVFENPKFGIMTLVSGTLMTTFIGLLVAIPAGTILSIYMSEFARPAVRETIKPILELLAGVPTVAFGYFALFFLTPIFQIFIPELRGFNLLVPGIVIGIMILPYIVSVAEDAMRAVPDTLREGGYALGIYSISNRRAGRHSGRIFRRDRRLHPRHVARSRRNDGGGDRCRTTGPDCLQPA